MAVLMIGKQYFKVKKKKKIKKNMKYLKKFKGRGSNIRVSVSNLRLKVIQLKLEYLINSFFDKFIVFKIKNIFYFKYNKVSKLLKINHYIYLKLRAFKRLAQSLHFRELLVTISVSLFFFKGQLLSEQLSKLLYHEKKPVLFMRKIQTILLEFVKYHLKHFSVCIGLFGKIRGQAKRASAFYIKMGQVFSLQNIKVHVSYAFNLIRHKLGAFGLKV